MPPFSSTLRSLTATAPHGHAGSRTVSSHSWTRVAALRHCESSDREHTEAVPYVYKLPSSKWRAVYRDRDGRRRSITRPTKSEARTEALERESEVRRGTW